MAKYLPLHVDELLFLAVLLLFLIINYNMPLSSIYSNMVIISLFAYLSPIMFNLFRWIPLMSKTDKLKEIIVGIGAGIGFIFFYKWLGSLTPMSSVFATTAFGESEIIGQFVFGFLIPLVETVFFYVIIPAWILWKIGSSLYTADMFASKTIIVALFSSGIATIFHATTKGIENNLDMFAVFAFSLLSIYLILYFRTALVAIIAHIVVNSSSIGIFEAVKNGALLSSPYIIVGGIVAYLLYTKKVKLPF